MEFKNRANKSFVVNDEDNQRLVWESRSVAVNGVIAVLLPGQTQYKILVSKRGPNAADFQGKMNVVAGYLDWDESGGQALMREAWEECGINLKDLIQSGNIIRYDLDQPWSVKTQPDENRQNVSLRYGIAIQLTSNDLPELSLDHNEVEGEVEEAFWMPASDAAKYQWAFNHDFVIRDYVRLLG